MHAGTITFNGLDLSGLGKPKLGITQQPDPPAPAFPTRQLVTLKVTVDIEAMDPATVQARVEHLQASMKVHEGILRSSTGPGHALEWLAIPGGNNLSAVLTGRANTLELTFSAVENHSPAAISGITAATFTPAGSSSPITLHAVRDIKEDTSTERHSPRASARKLTTTTISLTARIAQANPADPLATRLAYLQAQAAAVKAIDCREGTLVFLNTNSIVRVTEFSPVIDEARGMVDLRLQCFYSVLPDNTKAEVDFTIDTQIDAGSGEQVLTYSGTISAETRTIALAKLEAIRAAEATGARRVVSFKTGDKRIDGADTLGIDGADWTGSLTFSLEIREPRAGSHYTLKIASTRDIRSGMRWNYSGSITAATDGAALALARSLVAATGHPIRTKSEENIEHVSDIYLPESGTQAGRHFVKLDFSYEFEGPSDGFIGGEITTDRNLPLFGEYRRMISGFLIATTREVAEGRLILLLAGEGAAIEKTLKWSDTYLDDTGTDATPKRVFQKLEFTAGSRTVRGHASVKYTDSTSTEIATMMQQRDVSGTIWTDSASHAETVLDTLIASIFGAAAGNQPTKIVISHAREKWGNATQVSSVSANSDWAQMDFQLSKASKITGTVGYDIIEAGYTLERVGCLNHTVVTPTPFGRPVVQVGTGHLPGTLSLNANCKARVAATARAWVQGKRALVNGIGSEGTTRHITAQPRETESPEYEPFSGSVTLLWNFTGSYQWTVSGTQLDGLWD